MRTFKKSLLRPEINCLVDLAQSAVWMDLTHESQLVANAPAARGVCGAKLLASFESGVL